MALNAGKLRHRVSVQELQNTGQNPVTGLPTTEWVEVTKRWASVEPLSVREFLAAGANQSNVTARIVMRYWSGLNPTMRIVYRSKIYNIAGALPDADSGLEYMTIPVSEGLNDGSRVG